MSEALRILILEDRPADAELVTRELRKAGFEFVAKTVTTENEFLAELRDSAPQLILADYSLPGYDGLSALAAAQKQCPETPFIFVSGSMGEEKAIETLHCGATDYVLKQRLARLGPSVRRALREREELRKREQAEKERHEAEARYRALFEQSPDGIVILDPETARPIGFNAAAHRQLGYSREEFARLSLANIEAKETLEQTRAIIDGVRREGRKDFETWQRTREGQIRHVHVTAQIVEVSGRSVYHCIWRDITERKQAEQRMRELNLVVRASGAIHALMVRERDPKRLLAEACKILVETRGYQFAWIGQVEPGSKRVVPAASAGKDADYLDAVSITWDESPTGQGPIGTAIRTGQPVACQDTATDPRFAPWKEEAMARGFASMAAMPMIHDSRVLGAVAVYAARTGAFDAEELDLLKELASDLSFALQSIEHEQERERAEEALRENERRYRLLFNSGYDAVFVHQGGSAGNGPGKFIEVNNIACQRLGYTREELLEMTPRDISAPETLPDIPGIRAKLAVEKSAVSEGVHITKDGRRILVEISTHVFELNGKPTRLSTVRDITERKQAEAALRESSQFNQQIVASAQEGIIVYGRDLKHQAWNPFMEQLTGIPAAQVLGKHPEESFPFLRDTGVLASIKKALAGEPTSVTDFHFEGLPSGRSGWASDTNGPLRNAAGEIIGAIGIVRDITERKRTEQSHARLVTAVEQSAETIMITDASDTILYANPAFEKTSGYNREEALGQNPRLLKSGKHDAEFYRQMWTVLGRGEVWSGRLINKKKDGTLYEEDATISPVRDPAGKVVNYVAVKRDVTHEAQLEAQLRQSQKMEAVGQLAGGVAHDFNNMLAVIRGNAELLLMDEAQYPAEAREGLKHVVQASERAANLTRQLLAFSRKQVLLPQPLVLNEVITNLTKMLKRVIGENIDLQCHYAAALPYVQADTGMMEQVILNLVVNARDAMPEGGQLCMATEQLSLDKARARVNPEARAGEFVCLLVSDTGTGIAPEVVPRIFEPFFTTKELGKGTGLGLATVYGIVQQHQGWIEVSSQLGKGSTFKVFLPAIPAPARLAAAAEAGGDVRGGTETILLVEDEHAVRVTFRRVLESKGYTIREATSAQEALEQWHSRAGEIALLLTDIVMPGEMTGRDLAERLWGQKPGLKVIFMSGYSAEVLGKNTDFIRRTRSCFLQKPSTSRAILETVRQCLDDKEPVAGSGEAGRAK